MEFPYTRLFFLRGNLFFYVVLLSLPVRVSFQVQTEAHIKKRKKSILLENTLLPFWVEMLFCFIVSLNIIPQLFLLFPFNQLSILRVKIVPHGFSFICIEIFAVIFITLRLLYKNSVSSSSSKSIGSPSRIAYWYCPVLLSK